MKKFLLLLFFFSFFAVNAQQKEVLFLGNSYTGVNNLPQLIKSVAASLGDTLITEANTPGGHTFKLHTTNASSIAKIQSRDWDYVVLQEQSQIPSLTPAIVGNDYSVPHSVTLNNTIKTNSSCTETVFYMTWGRENGDASYCAQHPPVCTYSGMQQELRNTYLFMADSNESIVSPVGVAWKTARDSFPNIDLYAPDGSHPSIQGSYLAACVFYATLYQKSPIGSTYLPIGVSNSEAFHLQTIASNTVLDSMTLWRINTHKPIADFNYTGGSTINFTNTSTNGTSYLWTFGDGNTSTLQNPSHTYTIGGNYTVQLTAYSNDTCFSSTSNQNIAIAPTGIKNIKKNSNLIVHPNPAANLIDIKTDFEYSSISIIDISGKIIKQSSSQTRINISEFKSGIYFIKLIGEKNVVVKKFVKE